MLDFFKPGPNSLKDFGFGNVYKEVREVFNLWDIFQPTTRTCFANPTKVKITTQCASDMCGLKPMEMLNFWTAFFRRQFISK